MPRPVIDIPRDEEGNCVVSTVTIVLIALAVVMAVHVLADRSGVPGAVLLVVAGLVYAVLPGPNLQLDPDVVLLLVIPPLLYAAALGSSLVALRGSARVIGGLSVGLVLATALAVGAVVSAVVPGLPLAAGVALGAAVSPPDPVAALAIGRRAGLPPRLITMVEGEGLLNDATALTTLQVAVAAAAGGAFSLGHAVGEFALAAGGGLAVGLAVALVVGQVPKLVDDALVETALSLATPFAAYVIAEQVHVSGVLAVVVAGLWLSHRAVAVQSGRSRLQSRPVWRLVEFLLEGYVFLLIGQQLPAVIRGLDDYPAGTIAAAAALTIAVVLVLRPLWLLAAARLPARLHARLGGDPDQASPLSGQEVLPLSWAGTRGVITLAAAFSLPLDFPSRNLILLCAYLVVLVTLLGQGLTFAPLLRRLKIGGPDLSEALVRNQARVAAVQAALQRLELLLERDPQLTASAGTARRAAQLQLERYSQRVLLLSAVEDDVLANADRYRAAVGLRRAMLDAEREELLAWRDRGQLSDLSLRKLERELDYQEGVLPAS